MRYLVCASTTTEHMGNTLVHYYPHTKCRHCSPYRTLDTDMPTSGNTNLYFEAHKPVFFNKNLYFLKTYTNRLPLPHFITRIFLSALLRCFAVAMCCVMSYLPLAAMLKSAEHNVHLAWFSPFLDSFMKSQLREYSSLKVCFLLFLDAITLINCIKYPGKICF